MHPRWEDLCIPYVAFYRAERVTPLNCFVVLRLLRCPFLCFVVHFVLLLCVWRRVLALVLAGRSQTGRNKLRSASGGRSRFGVALAC